MLIGVRRLLGRGSQHVRRGVSSLSSQIQSLSLEGADPNPVRRQPPLAHVIDETLNFPTTFQDASTEILMRDFKGYTKANYPDHWLFREGQPRPFLDCYPHQAKDYPPFVFLEMLSQKPTIALLDYLTPKFKKEFEGETEIRLGGRLVGLFTPQNTAFLSQALANALPPSVKKCHFEDNQLPLEVMLELTNALSKKSLIEIHWSFNSFYEHTQFKTSDGITRQKLFAMSLKGNFQFVDLTETDLFLEALLEFLTYLPENIKEVAHHSEALLYNEYDAMRLAEKIKQTPHLTGFYWFNPKASNSMKRYITEALEYNRQKLAQSKPKEITTGYSVHTQREVAKVMKVKVENKREVIDCEVVSVTKVPKKGG